MPNWCHNTLTVTGEADELARFVEAARPSEPLVRKWWRQAKADRFFKEKRTFKQYLADIRASQPLSFDALVPQPSDEELKALENYKPCTMCGAVGTLPDNEDEAILRGARWLDWMDPAKREDRTCNVCGGTGQERVGMEGWYRWRTSNWGTKWDASFGEPFMALGSEDANVDACIEAEGATLTPTVAVYKFDTAWAPPAAFVETTSEQFPELEFTLRYGEPGNGYAGQMRVVGGLTVEDDELEVEDVLAPEEMWF